MRYNIDRCDNNTARCDSYSFDIAESEFDNQIAPSPTNVKGGGIKLKNYVCNEKVSVIYWFVITIYNVK